MDLAENRRKRRIRSHLHNCGLNRMLVRFLIIAITLAPHAFCDINKIASQQLSIDCDNETQFKCRSENRCIPIRYRCDFTEQCLDGEDEFRCAPSWCDFDSSLCNWKNNFDDLNSSGQQQDAWRRFQQPTSPLQNDSLGSKLGQLNAKTRQFNKFAFVPMTMDTAKSGVISRIARFSSPVIGQTNSMCQLRFKYAMLVEQTAVLANKDYRVIVNLGLSLLERGQDRKVFVWSKTIDSNFIDQETASNWSYAVIELNHLSQFELSFEAQATLVHKSPRNMEDNIKHSTLIALDWIKFQNCAWPARSTPIVYGTSDDENNKQQREVASCSNVNDFQCAASNLCLNRLKLCNFVDDCMSHDDQTVESKSGPVGEDESEDLCGQIPGRESFEPSQGAGDDKKKDQGGDYGQSQLSPRMSEFWTLAGNWPWNRIRILNSLQTGYLQDSLPRRDHTLRSPSGHYLSLEVPKSSSRSLAFQQRNYINWLYIYSPWLVKTRGSDTCRVKFFYNLVSNAAQDNEIDFITKSNQIYISVEHFVLNQELSQDLTNPSDGLTRKIDSFTYSKFPSMETNEILIQLKKQNFIEMPGLDFWRELNIELADLKEAEMFYIRLAFIVESKREFLTDDDSKLTVNIDDLGTHFGCQQPKDLKDHQINGQQPSSLSSSFNLHDYLRPADSRQNANKKEAKPAPLSTYHRRRSKQTGACAIQFEPHKLIIYVFGVLAAILSLIMIIVFFVVPYVERMTISYHDRLAAGLEEINQVANHRHSYQNSLSSATPNSSFLVEACELTTESDWEQISRQWRGHQHGTAGLSRNPAQSPLVKAASFNVIHRPTAPNNDDTHETSGGQVRTLLGSKQTTSSAQQQLLDSIDTSLSSTGTTDNDSTNSRLNGSANNLLSLSSTSSLLSSENNNDNNNNNDDDNS